MYLINNSLEINFEIYLKNYLFYKYKFDKIVLKNDKIEDDYAINNQLTIYTSVLNDGIEIFKIPKLINKKYYIIDGIKKILLNNDIISWNMPIFYKNQIKYKSLDYKTFDTYITNFKNLNGEYYVEINKKMKKISEIYNDKNENILHNIKNLDEKILTLKFFNNVLFKDKNFYLRNRDHYYNKEVRGYDLNLIFAIRFICEHEIKNNTSNLYIITEKLKKSFKNGNFIFKKYTGSNLNLTETYEELNQYSGFVAGRTIYTITENKNKMFEAKKVHESQKGFICPIDSPDGENCGLIKRLSKKCEISVHIDSTKLRNFMKSLNYNIIFDGILLNYSNTFKINEKLPYLIEKVESFKKYYNYKYISYNKYDNFFMIRTNGSRYCKEINEIFIDTISQYYKEGFSNLKYPEDEYSISCNLIPFLNHNPSSRESFYCNQLKQTIEIHVNNVKFPKKRNEAYSVQKPLIKTLQFDELYKNNPELVCNGTNVMLLIATYEGLNFEDGYVINKSSIQRGLFNSITKFTKKYNITSYLNYEILIKIGDVIKNNTKIIKYEEDNFEYLDILGECRIVEIYVTNVFINIVYSRKNNVNSGDKLTMRTSQKGVICGIISEENLPFNSRGEKPDIIINPHALPSRMTIGLLMEVFLGKLKLKNISIESVPVITDEKYMKKFYKLFYKYKNLEKDEFYNPYTGKNIKNYLVYGPCYYNNLKHLVEDKISCTNIGKTNAITNQPIQGKKGSIKFGEMEKEILIANNTLKILYDKLIESSDKKYFKLCKTCKHLITENICNYCLIYKYCIICGKNSEEGICSDKCLQYKNNNKVISIYCTICSCYSDTNICKMCLKNLENNYKSILMTQTQKNFLQYMTCLGIDLKKI